MAIWCATLDHASERAAMSRETLPGERLPILRALATCIARDVPLRIWDESRAACLRLILEVDRDQFYRALRMLLDRGAVDTARLFERHRGPGIPEEIARDRVGEFAQTLTLCAEAGYEVTIKEPAPGRPTEVAPADHVLEFTVRVNAEAYYGMRPHQF